METISQFSNTVYVQSFYIHVRDEIKDKKKMNARDTLEQRREIDCLDNHNSKRTIRQVVQRTVRSKTKEEI